jgi:Uri superfamily endonuclease
MRQDAPLRLEVGRLGTFDFEAGLYAYIGSAHGPGGLRGRVMRHLRHDKAPHWHIDRLTACVPVVEVWWRESTARLECRWAQLVGGLPGAKPPAPGFGASDCACPAHLFLLPAQALRDAQARLARSDALMVAAVTGHQPASSSRLASP